MTKPVSPLTYRQAGVDIDAGNALVEKIKPLAKSTARAGTASGLGGFGALFDLKAAGYNDPVLVSTTDGVGTKLKLAIDTGKFDTIGIDLVAMCVNDLIVQGAEPLFFLDYFATGKLDVAKGEAIIKGIAEGCRDSGCALIGGETAEMPGMYHGEDFDLAGFSVGAAERGKLLPSNDIKAGDILLGIASSGFHSNGYSLVRKVAEKIPHSAKPPFASDKKTFGEALLTPTKLYVKSLLAAIRETGGIKALAHITGGGLTENLPRVLPESLGATIQLGNWEVLPCFRWIQREGNIEPSEMLRTFNCGIGMVAVVSSEKCDAVKTSLEKQGETVFEIGALNIRGKDPVEYTGSFPS